MKRAPKLLLGAITFAAVVYDFMYLFFFVALDGRAFSPAGRSPWFYIATEIFFAALIASVLLLLFYGTHVYLGHRVPRGSRARWLLFLISYAPITMPLYWYVFLWREAPCEDPLSQPWFV